MSKSERYVALFDILGFKHLVEKNQLEEVVLTFKKFLVSNEAFRKYIQNLEGNYEISYRLFSDTILIYTRDISGEAFEKLLFFCDLLVSFNFKQKIMLRGAITKGEVFIDDNIIIGQPIVRAYLMEQEQEWIGCWIEDQCVDSLEPNVKSKMVNTYLMQYAIPLKSGKVGHKWALTWANRIDELIDAKNLDAEIDRIFQENTKPEAVTWDVKRKFDNTKTFIKRAVHLTNSEGGTP